MIAHTASDIDYNIPDVRTIDSRLFRTLLSHKMPCVLEQSEEGYLVLLHYFTQQSVCSSSSSSVDYM